MTRQFRQRKSNSTPLGSSPSERRRYRPRIEALEERTLLATIRWTNPTGGSWHVAGNWDLNRVPDRGDDVLIDLPGNYIVQHSSPGYTDINSLTSAKAFTLSGGQMRVRAQIQMDDTFTISSLGNPVELLGATILAGTEIVTSGALVTFREVTLFGDASVTGRLTVADGLTLYGNLNVGGSFLAGDVAFTGTQRLTGAGAVVFNQLENRFGASAGPVTVGPDITVLGGRARLSNVVSQGVLDLYEPDARLTLEGDSWRNAGIITLRDGALVLAGTFPLAAVGNIQRTGGTVNLAGVLDNRGQALVLSAATGSWNLAGGTITGGSVSAIDGQTLRMANGGILQNVQLFADLIVPTATRLTLGGTWRNRAQLTVNGGRLELDGVFTRSDVGALQRTGGQIVITGRLENMGRELLLDASTGMWLLDAEGVLNGGTLTTRDGAQLLGISGGRLHNVTVNGEVSGSIKVSGGLTLGGTLRGTVDFLGTQTLAGTGLVREANLITNGVVTLASGITVRNSRLNHVRNLGTIVVDNPTETVFLLGNWQNAGTIRLSAGALALGGTFTFAALGNVQRTGGSVILTGTLDNRGSTLLLNAATGSWQLSAGTILGGTVQTAANAQLLTSSAGGTLDGVTLNPDVTISQGTSLSFAGAWVNRGRLTLNGGTLNLGGGCTLAALGIVQRTGGTVNLTGTLNNTGATLRLDDTSGSWRLAGGTISRGTVVTTGNARLLAGSGGRLDGVTVNGTIEGGAAVTAVNGLTVNGTFTGTGTLLFDGTQTLAGTALVEWNVLRGVNGTVTLGQNVTVRGPGEVENFRNLGTIDMATPNLVRSLRGNGWRNEGLLQVSNGTLSLQGNSWRNDGTIRVSGGSLHLDGTCTLAALGNIQRTGGSVSLVGLLDNRGTVLNLNTVTGSWGFAGTILGGTLRTAGGASLTILAGTLDSVRIETDLDVGQDQRLTLLGNWTNRGRLTMTRGNVFLGGNFSVDELGDFRRTDGEVALVGTLENHGRTLVLNATTGSWSIRGGTINGGTVAASGGALLHVIDSPPSEGARLNNVTLNGSLLANGPLTVANGFVLNGTVTVSGASFLFDGPQTMSGTGTIVFTPSDVETNLQASRGLSTLGPGITVRGRVRRITGFINQGTILISDAQEDVLLEGQDWRNEGTIRLSAGRLNLGGLFSLPALGNFQRTGGEVFLRGTLVNTGTALHLNAATSSWFLAGGTIVGGVVRTTDGTALIPLGFTSTLSAVTIQGDFVLDGNLILSGSWRNEGRITLRRGLLTLGGTFTTAALGDFRQTGGTVTITGTLNNAGSTLQLGASNGVWNLAGGTIQGGVVSATGGARLASVATTPATLRDVTLNSDLDVIESRVSMVNVTLNGTVTLGREQFFGGIFFSGVQTLDGNATILFQGRDPTRNVVAMSSSNAILTLGPNVTIRGSRGGVIGYSAQFAGTFTNLTLINEGTILSEATGQTITVAAATIMNRGTWESRAGASLALQRRDDVGAILNLGTMSIDSSTITADDILTQLDGAILLSNGTLTTPFLDLRGGLLAGAGTIMGSVGSDAFIQVGFAEARGTLTITGDYTQGSAGILAMTLGGREPGVTYDQVRVGGTATLDGTLALTVLDTFFADPGDTFTLMEFGGVLGEFAAYEGLEPPGQPIHFEPLFGETSFALVAVPN